MQRNNSMYVDGSWRDTTGSDKSLVVNPHTEEPWAETMSASANDVDLAVCSADRALHGEWAQVPLDERIAMVLRIRELMQRRKLEIGQLQTRSMGCLYKYAPFLGGALELIDMFVESARKVAFDYLRSDRFGNSLISRRPVGVVAGIVPWNAPVRSEIKKAIPALLSGCSVVLKPAPETPFAAAKFAEICSEAGVPPGVVNVVFGGPATGEELVRHPKVRKIAFTGSSVTGAKIAALASSSFKRLQLELGGKSAAIVLEDANLEETVPLLVTSAWSNSGQACSANTRILAPRKRYGEIVEALVAAAAAQVVGDPMDPATTLGPLVSKRQRDRVLSYVAIGRSEGAQVVAGGGPPGHLERGYYVSPTVFTAFRNEMRIAQEEIFGPVTCVIPYATEEQAVAIANDTAYGLHGGVYGQDQQHALSIARQLDTGSVGVNQYFLASSAPFGGVKHSGIGREHGPEGFDSFLEYASYNVSPTLAAELSNRYPAG